MNKLITILIVGFNFLTVNSQKSSMDFRCDKDYTEYLKIRLDSADKELNRIYQHARQWDNEGFLLESQRDWIKFRDSNVDYIVNHKRIIGSTSEQIKLQALLIMTEQRTDELKGTYTNGYKGYNFPTASSVDETFYFSDEYEKIPEIQYDTIKYRNDSIYNFQYVIHKRVRRVGGGNHVDIYIPDSEIPYLTKKFTHYQIENKFILEKYRPDMYIGLRCDDVIFRLIFEPDDENINYWKYSLSVDRKDCCKPYGLCSFKIDLEGRIVEKKEK